MDGVIYVSGTLPFDGDNNVVHVSNAGAQTRHVLETIEKVIETAGGTMADVTFDAIFITDWANYRAVNAVYAEYLPGENAHPVPEQRNDRSTTYSTMRPGCARIPIEATPRDHRLAVWDFAGKRHANQCAIWAGLGSLTLWFISISAVPSAPPN